MTANSVQETGEVRQSFERSSVERLPQPAGIAAAEMAALNDALETAVSELDALTASWSA